MAQPSLLNDVGSQLEELSRTLRSVTSDPIKGFGVLSGDALKHAALVTGISRSGRRFTRLHDALEEEATVPIRTGGAE